MMYIIKGILFVLGVKKLYEAIMKENFECFFDATLIFAGVFLLQFNAL